MGLTTQVRGVLPCRQQHPPPNAKCSQHNLGIYGGLSWVERIVESVESALLMPRGNSKEQESHPTSKREIASDGGSSSASQQLLPHIQEPRPSVPSNSYGERHIGCWPLIARVVDCQNGRWIHVDEYMPQNGVPNHRKKILKEEEEEDLLLKLPRLLM